ncbi:hypothetical protein [Pseudomonas sp. R1-7]|uniref:hypothetical protein n=1 Tax=Pseudomonas sp. R1-7 TaxID=2817398 RepID=UPI003DA96C9D
MSLKAKTTNLLLNGDFSDGAQHWTTEGNVEFRKNMCAMELGSSAFQTVNVASTGEFRFSVKMKTASGSAAKATLVANPSGAEKSLSVSGNQDWTAETFLFAAPDDTNSITVKLEGNDGQTGKLGSFFDDLRLEYR